MQVISEGEAVILQGHCLDWLRQLPSDSVHCAVTSPPYFGLRDYGTGMWEGGDPECTHGVRRWEGPLQKQGAQSGHAAKCDRLNRKQCQCGALRIDQQIGQETDLEDYIQNLIEIFREVRRVLRPDGTFWLNLGDSYAAHRGRQVPDSKHRSVGNNHGARVPQGLKAKDLMLVPHRVALAAQADGWWVRSDIIWQKNNVMPESVRDRPTRCHEYIFLLTKTDRYFYDAEAIREEAVYPAGTRGGKGSKERAAVPGVNARPPEYKVYDGYRNKRSVWQVNTGGFSGAHFAVFPPDLITPCIKAGTSEYGCCAHCGAPYLRDMEVETRPNIESLSGKYDGEDKHRTVSGGVGNDRRERIDRGWKQACRCAAADPSPCVVLDPFLGSGTTLLVARSLGRLGIGIELNLEYAQMAKERVYGA